MMYYEKRTNNNNKKTKQNKTKNRLTLIRRGDTWQFQEMIKLWTSIVVPEEHPEPA